MASESAESDEMSEDDPVPDEESSPDCKSITITSSFQRKHCKPKKEANRKGGKYKAKKCENKTTDDVDSDDECIPKNRKVHTTYEQHDCESPKSSKKKLKNKTTFDVIDNEEPNDDTEVRPLEKQSNKTRTKTCSLQIKLLPSRPPTTENKGVQKDICRKNKSKRCKQKQIDDDDIISQKCARLSDSVDMALRDIQHHISKVMKRHSKHDRRKCFEHEDNHTSMRTPNPPSCLCKCANENDCKRMPKADAVENRTECGKHSRAFDEFRKSNRSSVRKLERSELCNRASSRNRSHRSNSPITRPNPSLCEASNNRTFTPPSHSVKLPNCYGVPNSLSDLPRRLGTGSNPNTSCKATSYRPRSRELSQWSNLSHSKQTPTRRNFQLKSKIGVSNTQNSRSRTSRYKSSLLKPPRLNDLIHFNPPPNRQRAAEFQRYPKGQILQSNSTENRTDYSKIIFKNTAFSDQRPLYEQFSTYCDVPPAVDNECEPLEDRLPTSYQKPFLGGRNQFQSDPYIMEMGNVPQVLPGDTMNDGIRRCLPSLAEQCEDETYQYEQVKPNVISYGSTQPCQKPVVQNMESLGYSSDTIKIDQFDCMSQQNQDRACDDLPQPRSAKEQRSSPFKDYFWTKSKRKNKDYRHVETCQSDAANSSSEEDESDTSDGRRFHSLPPTAPRHSIDKNSLRSDIKKETSSGRKESNSVREHRKKKRAAEPHQCCPHSKRKGTKTRQRLRFKKKSPKRGRHDDSTVSDEQCESECETTRGKQPQTTQTSQTHEMKDCAQMTSYDFIRRNLPIFNGRRDQCPKPGVCSDSSFSGGHSSGSRQGGSCSLHTRGTQARCPASTSSATGISRLLSLIKNPQGNCPHWALTLVVMLIFLRLSLWLIKGCQQILPIQSLYSKSEAAW